SAVPAAARSMKIELWIEIDIGGEQGFDDIHARNPCAGGAPRDRRILASCRSALPSTCFTVLTTPAGACFSIDSDVERRASPPIPKIGIRSTIQQEPGDIVVVVVEGEHQRGYALGRRRIHIGAGCNQRLDTVVATVTRRIQQRGQSSNWTVLRAG